jgi:hypothetical protein
MTSAPSDLAKPERPFAVVSAIQGVRNIVPISLDHSEGIIAMGISM